MKFSIAVFSNVLVSTAIVRTETMRFSILDTANIISIIIENFCEAGFLTLWKLTCVLAFVLCFYAPAFSFILGMISNVATATPIQLRAFSRLVTLLKMPKIILPVHGQNAVSIDKVIFEHSLDTGTIFFIDYFSETI